jgi:hypothetical protein
MASRRSGIPLGPMMESIKFARHYISSFGCSFQTPCGVGTSTLSMATGGDICLKS